MVDLHLNKSIIELIIDKYGAPVYIYDQDKIEQNYSKIFSAFKKYYDDFQICYAIKANNNLAILKILSKIGAGFDCSSKGDIYLANKIPSKFNIYTGNNCAEEELTYAMNNKMMINLDDISLLDKMKSAPEIILFRIKYVEKNPFLANFKNWTLSTCKFFSDMIKGKPFSVVILNKQFSKFGINENKIFEAFKLARKKGVKKFGIHIMGDSNVLDPVYFRDITKKLMEIVLKLKNKQGIIISYLDIGGGFGIDYSGRGKKLDIEKVARSVAEVINNYCKRYNLKKPKLIIEPGRYLVGNAGCLVGRVHSVKDGKTKLIGTDLPSNFSFVSLHPENKIEILNKNQVNGLEKVSLYGQLCWSFDIIRKDVVLPKISIGDFVIIRGMGAYGYALNDQFNSRERPAEILVRQNSFCKIRKRENIDEFDRLVHIPSHLE